MSSFRSEEMHLYQIYLQSESAYSCISELGELGLVQFKDLNQDINAFQRNFVNEVRTCDELERKLRYLYEQIQKRGTPIFEPKDIPLAPLPREMIDLEAILYNLENELREENINSQTLNMNFLELLELKHILKHTELFFDEQRPDQSREDESVNLLSDESIHRARGQPLKFGFFAGVIPRLKIPGFERMLWRTCHGNVFLRFAEIDNPVIDPPTGKSMNKSVFILFFQGEQLKNRVQKICQGYHATLYPCPETSAERRDMAINVMTRIEDLTTVLSQTQDHGHRVLVATAKNIKDWFIKIRKMKAIYHTLNLFSLDVTQKCLIAECWLPAVELNKIQQALRTGTERSNSTITPILQRVQTREEPPTFMRTNKFTFAFQAIIDAYGVANYQEINPAPFTIITFPFLFSIMFGDIGHGMIMFLFAAWMIVKEKQLIAKNINNEVWLYFFGGRYIIILMGLFSIYTGAIYNDIFSKSINVFGSKWTYVQNVTIVNNELHCVFLSPSTDEYLGTPYLFGFDPIWQYAHNKILFHNSFKMKISIIVGIFHMLFGVVISLANHIYFKRPLDIICEFVPQIIFLCSLFLYLVLLMFIKWVVYFSTDDPDYVKYSPHCAPLILITFINMVLFKTTIVPPECDKFMFAGQLMLQKVLVFSALICVPWMLFLKPFIIIRRQRQMSYLNPRNVQKTIEEANLGTKKGGKVKEEEEDLGNSEMLIHQGIHTIEYVLGSISHTASYLRLWALSLAHGQLSDVLWNMVLSKGLTNFGNCNILLRSIFLWIVFGAWALFTISILVLMEGLSAFLHCLRLHWVEFQSKFYSGAGYAFKPFSFRELLKFNNLDVKS